MLAITDIFTWLQVLIVTCGVVDADNITKVQENCINEISTCLTPSPKVSYLDRKCFIIKTKKWKLNYVTTEFLLKKMK